MQLEEKKRNYTECRTMPRLFLSVFSTKTLAFAKIRPPCASAPPSWSGASWTWAPRLFLVGVCPRFHERLIGRGFKRIWLKDSSDRQDTRVQSNMLLAHLFVSSAQSAPRSRRRTSMKVLGENDSRRSRPFGAGIGHHVIP
jgi:hypothetical protein